MRRRLPVLLAVVAAAAISVGPVLAADVTHVRLTGQGLYATLTDGLFDSTGQPLVDSWERVDIAAGQGESGSEVCVNWSHTTYDGTNAITDWIIAGCAPAESLVVDPNMKSGSLRASVPGIFWADPWPEVGTFTIEVALTGIDKAVRSGEGYSIGTPGADRHTMTYRYAGRGAAASGTITFNGDSLLPGGTWRDAILRNVTEGYVDIIIH